jgi:hypothetical protein
MRFVNNSACVFLIEDQTHKNIRKEPDKQRSFDLRNFDSENSPSVEELRLKAPACSNKKDCNGCQDLKDKLAE